MSMFILFSFLGFLSFTSEAAPVFSALVCTNGTYFDLNSTFPARLNILLSYLTSNASLPDGYYRTTVSPATPFAITGLLLCRGDITPTLCQQCAAAAAKEIRSLCLNQTESIIWYDVCLLRYSNQSLNPIVPGMYLQDNKSIDSAEQDQFENLLSSLLNDVTAKANIQTGKKFATAQVNFTWSEKLYSLAQCTPDLSNFDCNTCFRSAIAFLPTCCGGKKGAGVLLLSCNIRYELYPFYNITLTSSEPLLPVPPPSGGSNVSLVVGIVVPIVVSVALFVVGCRFLRKRASKKYNTITEDGIGNYLSAIQSVQFELATREAATNRFSDEKKIGQGGFGAVYKGVLPDGQEIAVKRLSVTSWQGALEFGNEAALVAKLQHRNLVRLLGFCLEGQEKILVYEFVLNKSLDHFLFGLNLFTTLPSFSISINLIFMQIIHCCKHLILYVTSKAQLRRSIHMVTSLHSKCFMNNIIIFDKFL